MSYIMALDQGTSSSRAIIFDRQGECVAVAQKEFDCSFPQDGWVEQDPEVLWQTTLDAGREALANAGLAGSEIAALGITNQRETTLVWDAQSSRAVYPAIVWQDRRTADVCRKLREEGREPWVQERTGLLLDPYFSATKLAWILDHVDGAREAAARGDLAFGTIDSWALWCLTGGSVHATDASNASRTMLFDIGAGRWDPELLDLFRVPAQLLPDVRDSAGDFGATEPSWFGAAIPIRGVAGDQQAATFGQAAFEPGTMKCTYGTGAFALLNTGEHRVVSQNRLLTTIAWRISGETTYALEGSIFMAGATVQWLRDGLEIIDCAAETAELAAAIDDTGGVYLIPAFVGLGAPYWDAEARGALVGLTRDTGREAIARAALEAVAYQTRELLEAMEADGASPPSALRVDGGLSRNDWAMQFLSDLLDVSVERPAVTETTALGAASLAGLAAGVFGSLEEISAMWRLDASWDPAMEAPRRNALFGGWQRAVTRVLSASDAANDAASDDG